MDDRTAAPIDSTPVRGASLSARIGNLDTLRGLAATGVLAAHVAFVKGFTQVPFWGDWVFRMIGFVNVFFVLSGFVLFRPYVVAAATKGPWPRLGRYATRRFFRIVPAYWLLIVVAFVLLAGRIPDIATWLQYLTFTQLYGPAKSLYIPGVGVAWTLTVEIVFYALLPLVAVSLLRGQWRPLRTLVVLMAVGFAISIGWMSQITPGRLNPFVHHVWFPTYAMCFAVGMAMAVISVALRTGTAPRWWAVFDRIGGAGWLCWGIALAFYACCVLFGGPTSGVLPTPSDLVIRELMYLGFAAFLLWPLVFGGSHALKTLLSKPVPRWVGTVSYGLFLWHVTVLELILRTPLRLSLSTTETFVLTLAGALAFAAISWYLVEQPAQRLGDRLLARSRRRSAPIAAPIGTPAASRGGQ